MEVVKFVSRNKLLRPNLRTASKRSVSYSVGRLTLPSLTLREARRDPLGTNETIRGDVARLIDLGVSQKVLAQRMGVTESWFSRWLNQKKSSPQIISVAALDGFATYLHELAAAIAQAGQHSSDAIDQVAHAGRRPTPALPPPPAGRKRKS
jgi:hypothetical protein